MMVDGQAVYADVGPTYVRSAPPQLVSEVAHLARR